MSGVVMVMRPGVALLVASPLKYNLWYRFVHWPVLKQLRHTFDPVYASHCKALPSHLRVPFLHITINTALLHAQPAL